MEGVPGTHKASKLASEDVISRMPENVITNIMNRLPIRDAVRTSILARNWKLKWTLLTELVINDEIPQSVGPDGNIYDDCRIISRLLFLLTGPVTMFVLCIPEYQILDVGDINNWILLLLSKGIKKFIILNEHETPIKLPAHLFSCLELTHLILNGCSFHLPPTFTGFPNLSSLLLRRVHFESGTFEEFLTWCPPLQIIDIDFYLRFNLDDIPKLENVKKLSLRPYDDYSNVVITISSIFQLLGFLPKLEVLYLDFSNCKLIVEDVAMKWVPSVFPCINTLTLYGIDSGCDSMLSCVFKMIWSSPNLQELRFFMTDSRDEDEVYLPPAELFSSDIGNNVVEQLQLQYVVVKRFRGSTNEICLIKYLLAYSPFLKRIAIYSTSSQEPYGKLMGTVQLLKLHRASPVAQIDFY